MILLTLILFLVKTIDVLEALNVPDPNIDCHDSLHCKNNQSSNSSNNTQSVCQTEECRIIADSIRRSMNESVDPCNRFNEYACGNWNVGNHMSAGGFGWDSTYDMKRMLGHGLLDIMNSGIQTNDIVTVKFGKKIYKACTDIDDMGKLGVRPISSVLSKIGDWPLTMDSESWDASKYTWPEVERYYNKLYGRTAFYNFGITDFAFPPLNYDIVVSPPLTPSYTENLIPRSEASHRLNPDDARWYSKYERSHKWTEDMEEYSQSILPIATAIARERGSNVSQEHIISGIKKMVRFQRKLYTLIRDCEGSSGVNAYWDSLRGYYTEVRHYRRHAHINWPATISDYFESIQANVTMSDRVEIVDIPFFKRLGMLLYFTPVRTLVDYIHWNFISYAMPLLFTNETIRFQHRWVEGRFEAPDPKREIEKRQVFCVSLDAVRDIAKYAYIKENFTDEVEEQVKEIIADIRQEHESKIRELTWLDDETRNSLLEDVTNFPVVLDCPNATTKDEYYDEFEMDSPFLDAILRYEKLRKKRAVELFGKTGVPKAQRYMMDTLDLKPRYSQTRMGISPGLFRPPFFDSQHPSYLNYALVGSFISRGFSHVFRNFDDRSDPRSRYEYIAETMEIQAAFRAFKRHEKRNGQSQKLPGLEKFNNDQLFFLARAHMECDKKESERMSVTNSEEFAAVFQCPNYPVVSLNRKYNTSK